MAQITHILLTALAVLPATWAALIFLTPPFPSLFRTQALVPGLALASYAAASLLLSWYLPAALPVLSLGGLLLAAAMQRARISYLPGMRGLPPGSLNFRRGVRSLSNRSFYLENIRSLGPIFKTTQFGRPTICVAGTERISRLIAENSDSLGPSPLPFTQSISGNFLRYMSDDTHNKYSPLFRRCMSLRLTEAANSELEKYCISLYANLSRQNARTQSREIRAFSRRCLDYLLFGFSDGDQQAIEFARLADDFYAVNIGNAIAKTDRATLKLMVAALQEQLQRTQALPGPSQPVLARLRELSPDMPDQTCLENLVFMHKIATNNVSSLLRWLVYFAATEKSVTVSIQNSAQSDRDKLLEAFLSETLRLSQSEYIYRTVSQSFTFGGYHFPRSWGVRCCVWESHRTDTRWPEPERFQLRLGNNEYERSRLSPFGSGRHACNGVDINRTICLVFLRHLFRHDSIEVQHSEPLTRGMRHWSHWQPNPLMTLKLGRRDE